MTKGSRTRNRHKTGGSAPIRCGALRSIMGKQRPKSGLIVMAKLAGFDRHRGGEAPGLPTLPAGFIIGFFPRGKWALPPWRCQEPDCLRSGKFFQKYMTEYSGRLRSNSSPFPANLRIVTVQCKSQPIDSC